MQNGLRHWIQRILLHRIAWSKNICRHCWGHDISFGITFSKKVLVTFCRPDQFTMLYKCVDTFESVRSTRGCQHLFSKTRFVCQKVFKNKCEPKAACTFSKIVPGGFKSRFDSCRIIDLSESFQNLLELRILQNEKAFSRQNKFRIDLLSRCHILRFGNNRRSSRRDLLGKQNCILSRKSVPQGPFGRIKFYFELE